MLDTQKIIDGYIHIPILINGAISNDSCLINVSAYDVVSQYKWRADRDGYACANKGGRHLRMHRLVIGAKQGEIVDHINRNPLDNRLENLRIASYSLNSVNTIKKFKSYSKYRGVSIDNRTYKKFIAQIKSVDVGSVYIGNYYTEEMAAYMYQQKFKEVFGEQPCLQALPDYEDIQREEIEKEQQIRSRYTSQYRGIYKHKYNNTWCVSIKGKYLGSFRSEEQAYEYLQRMEEAI